MRYRYRNEEEMKDSEVEWIGKIPSEWNITSIKHVFNIIGGGTPDSTNEMYWDGDIIWVTPKDISNNIIIYDSERKITEAGLKSSSAKMIPLKSLIITTRAPIGNIAINNVEVTTNQGCHSMVKKTYTDNKYYYYYLLSANKEMNALGSGTTFKEISRVTLSNMKTIILKQNEEEKIAKFLDEKTAQFDSIISKKEELIQKLEEAKKSLISEVVTGKVKVVKTSNGYDLVERKKEEMKDIGVEWLGYVPKEWNVFRSKYLWKKEKREVKEWYDVITAFRDGEVTLRTNRRTDGFTFSIKEIGYQGVLKGDLVISAMDAFAGAMGISDSEGKCSPVYSVCSPMKDLSPEYYKYLLKEMSQKGYILSLAKGIRERSTDFRYSEFANTSLLYPEISEQERIARFLSNKIDKTNHLIRKIKLQILKLKETKQSLISEAVTGKIEILD